MKIGYRKPSLKKRVAARASWKRVVRHRMGIKAPRGYGWLSNPRRAAYNRVYSRTNKGCLSVPVVSLAVAILVIVLAFT